MRKPRTAHGRRSYERRHPLPDRRRTLRDLQAALDAAEWLGVYASAMLIDSHADSLWATARNTPCVSDPSLNDDVQSPSQAP